MPLGTEFAETLDQSSSFSPLVRILRRRILYLARALLRRTLFLTVGYEYVCIG